MGNSHGRRGKAAGVRVAEVETGTAPAAASATDRVTAVRDTVGNRTFGAMLAEQRGAKGLMIVKVTAFEGRREWAQATLSDGSFVPIPLSQNDLKPGSYRFERDETRATHYRQVEQEGLPVAPFLWQPKPVLGDAPQRAEVVEVEVFSGTPQSLREDIAALDPGIQRALTTTEGRSVASYSEMQRIVAAGSLLQQAGVTADELELLEYRAERERGFGREPAQAADALEWASDFVVSRQEAGEAALANRTTAVAAREQIDALPPQFGDTVGNLALKNYDASWKIIRGMLETQNISLDAAIAAFDTELRAVTDTFLSQGLLALHRIDKMYLANRNVGVERQALRRAMQAVRPAVFQREAGRHELTRQIAQHWFTRGNEAKVAEWKKEVEQREENLKEESQAAGLPVAAWKGFDPDLILDEDVDALRTDLRAFVYDARVRLHRAEEMSASITNLYKADKMIALAKTAIGIQPGSLFGRIIDYRVKRWTDDGFWSKVWDVVTFALMFVPGNIGVALRVGAGLVNMSREAETYAGARTRSLTGLSSADPSRGAFYLAAGSTFIDASQMAKGTFRVIGDDAAAAAASRGNPIIRSDPPPPATAPVPDVPAGAAPPRVPDVPAGAAPPPVPDLPAVAPPPSPQPPLVWVNTGRGAGRGRYHPEGTRWFENTKEGVTLPRSWADDLGFVPAGTPRNLPAPPITPRIVNGRQAESMGANAGKPPKFISATARAESAVNTTSIPPDIEEALAYNHFLDQFEVGLQRPLGANAPGVDAITAQIERNAAGKPIGAKIFVNDMTTPSASKSLNGRAEWLAEVDDAVSAARLDFGDPDLHRVLEQAAVDNVYVRIVRVDRAGGAGGVVTVRPGEVRKIR